TDRMLDGINSCSASRALWAEIGDRAQEGNSLTWLSRMAWYSARTDEAQRFADLAVATLEALPPGPELAMAWCVRAGLYVTNDQGAAAVPFAERALQLTRKLGNREIEAHTLNNLAVAYIQLEDERGWSTLEKSLRLSIEHGLEDAAGRAYANLGSLAVE